MNFFGVHYIRIQQEIIFSCSKNFKKTTVWLRKIKYKLLQNVYFYLFIFTFSQILNFNELITFSIQFIFHIINIMRDHSYYQYHHQHRALESRFYRQNDKEAHVTMLNTQKKEKKREKCATSA